MDGIGYDLNSNRLYVTNEPMEFTSRRIGKPSLIFCDPLMRRVVERAQKIAASDSPLLISGETGTGKEVIARYVHQHSSRRERAFVALNCAAIPDGLLEAELFGHERGAFSGAISRRCGKMEIASGGTLLLDEIGELDVRLQAKLLRALQEQEIDRVGGHMAVKINIRIIATTNKQLNIEVDEKRFRKDFYYRLNTTTIHIPSLRERPNDIIALSEYFLSKYRDNKRDCEVVLDHSARRQLMAYEWPGNVRELENAIQRALVLSVGNTISGELLELPHAVAAIQLERNDACSAAAKDKPALLKNQERDTIIEILRDVSGNQTQAARRLGISVKTLRRKLRLYAEEIVGPPS